MNRRIFNIFTTAKNTKDTKKKQYSGLSCLLLFMFLLQESQSEHFQNQEFLERTQILIRHELTPCQDELTNVFYELILIYTPATG